MNFITANLLAITMRPGRRYDGWRWRYVARYVRRRDDMTCRNCDDHGHIVHHVTHVSEGGSHFTWNLRTVCRRCHADFHPDNRWLKV